MLLSIRRTATASFNAALVLAASSGLTLGVSQTCPVNVSCDAGSTLAQTPPASDSFGPSLAPWADPVLNVPKFFPQTWANLHGVPVSSIELKGVELRVSTTVHTAEVRYHNLNQLLPCTFRWTYDVLAGVQANPGLGLGSDVIADVNLASGTSLPIGDGSQPPPWHYEWLLNGDGNGPQSNSVCTGLTNGLGAWTAQANGEMASFMTTSAALDDDQSNCGGLVKQYTNTTSVNVEVVYFYCFSANQPPVCNAGEAQAVECRGSMTEVSLDGTKSFDPDNTALTFEWSVDCPGAFFDNANSPMPKLYIDATQVGCEFDCIATLRVTDGAGRSSQCNVTISVHDTKAPKILCPPDAQAACDVLDPLVLGMPWVQDSCDPNPTITFEDQVLSQEDCAASRAYQVIRRLWTATDECGHSASCIQLITTSRVHLDVDAIPGSCPNVFRNADCPETTEEICVGGPAKPSLLTMVYTGDDCSASQTDQDSGAWGCSGDPNDAPFVHILATNKINGGNIHTWFEGDVALGSEYQIDAALAGMSWLQANVHIRIYSPGGDLLQHTYFHSSCSEPLAVGDQFGANLIVGFISSDGSTGGGNGGGGGGGAAEDLIVTIPGSATLDVSTLDLDSIALWGTRCEFGGLQPISSSFGDVTGPSNAPVCGPCANPGPDGFIDVSFTFDWQEVMDSLGLEGLPQGELVQIFLTGQFANGCPFLSSDCLFMDTCEPSGGGESVCDGEGPPNILEVKYTGEDCSATQHNQEASAVDCSGDPASAASVRVVAQMPVGGQWLWFDSVVALGETFSIDSANAGQSNLKSKIRIQVFDLSGNLLQEVGFHTSCSQPLNVGDQYGSMLITGFVND